jgi:hypothetical protein
MPAPKFQQSSGYLPQGYLEKAAFEAPPPADVSPNSAATAAAPALATEPDIEPQPDLNIQLEAPPAPNVPAPAVKQRSAGARVALIVLGLLAMVAFIAAFLALIYYLFAPQGGQTTF